MSSVDSSSSSDEDSEIQEQENRVKELEELINKNPYSYDAHVELVKLYRKLGDLTSMREAFRRFSNTFPLTAELWLQWIRTEVDLATTQEQKDAVLELFKRAIQDYLSADVWLEYINYSMTINLSSARFVIESALTKIGLHFINGSLIWDFLRELEAAELSTLTPATDTFNAQLIKLVAAFKRQLSVPLRDMHKTYDEWKKLEKTLPEDAKIDVKPLEWGYKNAIKMMEKYQVYEMELEEAEEKDVCGIYKKYINEVKDPSTVFCLYERAVERSCLVSQVWIEYCEYAIKIDSSALEISSRALRNITWDVNLWVLRLRLLERLGKPYSDVLASFEEGISVISNDTSLELWLTFLDYAHRNKLDAVRLGALFEQALSSVGIYDALFAIQRFQAQISATSDMSKARLLWKEIFANVDNRDKAHLWMEYVSLELKYGTVKDVRNAFDKAIRQCKERPLYVVDSWLIFERTNGTLDTLLTCVEKCRHINVAQLAPYTNESSVSEDSNNKKRNRSTDKDTSNKRFKGEESNRRQFKNGEDNLPKTNRSLKVGKFCNLDRKRGESGRPTNLDITKSVFVSNLSPRTDKASLDQMFPNGEVTLATDKMGESRCFGYVQFETETEAAEAIARDREFLEGRPVFISKCKADALSASASQNPQPQFKYSTKTEKNKLFIRGLSYNTTEAKLLDLYRPLGALAVRIVTQKSGQSKGLAYVEFTDDTHAKQAIERTDGLEIDGRTVSVALSAPPPRKGDPAVGRSGIMIADRGDRVLAPRNKLQMAFLPRSLAVKKLSVQSKEEGSSETESVSIVDGAGDAIKNKSNDDFRKMYLKN